MNVSGLGAMGLGPGAAMGSGAAANVSLASVSPSQPAAADAVAKSAPPPTTVSEYYDGAMSPNLEALVNHLSGFSTAEILIALMILSAGQREEDQPGSGSSALSLLAGLALTGTCSQQPGLDFPASPPPAAVSHSMGGLIDVSA